MQIVGKYVNLIAVDHASQWNETLSKKSELRGYLNKIIESCSVDLIGEEFSIEALQGLPNSTEATIPQKVAKEFHIRHEFCDPDEKTRERIGYPSQKQLRVKFGLKSAIEGTKEHSRRKEYEKCFWPIREKYWLAQIHNIIAKNIIFICGSSHLESFKSILTENRYRVTTTKI